MTVESTISCTEVTDAEAVTVALTVMVPLTVAPLEGAVMLTVGAGMTLFTVTEICAVELLAPLSVAVASSVCAALL
jgi:hypothetical protein